uniref:BTB domain-containing protein n=1 Tax=Caenorhabditis japonica TaxID=281687 RepID=A0A8R1HP05_CAEJA
MIRQEPKIEFLYENVDLSTFEKPKCDEVDFAAFEDVHAKACLRISKNADLEVQLRRDGPPDDQWLARGTITIILWNEQFHMDGSYPATWCNEKPVHVVDLMSRKALKQELSSRDEELFNVDVTITFDKWQGLKVLKHFQFGHKYQESDLHVVVKEREFFVNSRMLFQEIPVFREYLEKSYEPGTTKYVLADLQGEYSEKAFDTMLQTAFRCSFITNIHEIGEVLTLAFRFNYQTLKKKCEYFLINEPENDWMQKLVFADLYDLSVLRQNILQNLVGLTQIRKHLHLHRFLSTETLRLVMEKAIELQAQKRYGDAPPSLYEKTYDLHEITENRWERLKRLPLTGPAPMIGESDVTTCVEKFESTFMPKHFGVDLITPKFSFAEKQLNLFTYKIQLGPDYRMLFKLDWNTVQTGNFVWSVNTAVHIRMTFLGGAHHWEHSERVCFDYDHQYVYFDGPQIQKVFPGGYEHLLDGLGNNPTLPKVEILTVVEKIRGLELPDEDYGDSDSMDDEWILQPSRTSPIVCCGKYLYVDKEVLRAKSRVFAKIFEQTYEPITIPISYDKFDVFASYLDVLHGDDVELDYRNVFGMTELARIFQTPGVLAASVEWLTDEPSMGKLQKLEMAEGYGIPELQKNVTDTILSLNELFALLRYLPNMSRRLIQILQDRLECLPLPEHDDTDEEN